MKYKTKPMFKKLPKSKYYTQLLFTFLLLILSVSTLAQADLVITKLARNQQPASGVTTFIVTVRNNGPNAATNVVVTDNINTSWTFNGSSYVVSHGALTASGTSNRNLSWTIPSIPNGGVAVLVFNANNVYNDWESFNRNNTATVTSITSDPNSANNSASVNTVVEYNSHNLAISKIVNNATPNVGQTVQFTTTLSRVGSDGSNAIIQVIDKLPPGLTYVSGSATVPSGDSYNPATGVWTISQNTYNFSSRVLTFSATVNSPTGAIDEYKSVAAISSVGLDTNILNNISALTISPGAPVNLSISKSVNNPTPNVGTDVTFTIGVNNIGSNNATGVNVNDALPAGYQYVSSSSSVGSYNNITGIWSIGNLAVSASQSLQITARVLPSGNHLNTATVSSNETDTNTANNTATASVTPIIPSADLSVTSIMSNYEPSPGNNVIYTITVQNNGPNATSGVIVTNQLPAGFNYVSNSASTGTYNSGTGVWTIGNFANGATATLQVTALMQPTGPYTQVVTVSQYGTDSVSSNNSDDATPTNVCAGCTHTISGGSITVNSGETYCLHSGSWSGGVILNTGGTICIAENATFTASYTTGAVNGTIINRGTLNLPLYTPSQHFVNINNYGTFNSLSIQGFRGEINNYGSLNISGNSLFENGAKLNNYGIFNSSNGITFNNTTVTNSQQLTINGGFNVNGGTWNNYEGAEVSINMTTQGSNVNFTGNLENAGLWRFARISSLNANLNNYGHMQVYNTVNDISTSTYLTNDDLLEFIDVSEVQFNGPMLTNNGILTISHATTGNFKMNNDINQVHNNSLIQITGSFEMEAANSALTNNCRIISRDFKVQEGTAYNNGLIHASRDFQVNGNPLSARLINNAIGYVRGDNFTNSGTVSGYGRFYFSGVTNMNSAGSFIGSDASNPIQFYDASQTGSNIFDFPGGTVSNVVRPPSMILVDTNSYACTAPYSNAGFPPTTQNIPIQYCDPGQSVSFDVDDYATANTGSPVLSDPFVLQYPSIRFFEITHLAHNGNPLTIAGKGTFSANTTNGLITFTPDAAFTSGTVEIEYRISNSRAGDPISYPSTRKKITITINCNCYKDPNNEPAESFAIVGVSSLSAPTDSWPGNVPNGMLALESSNKGFVITRVPNQNSITEPKEGMLIYDIQAGCIKLHNGTDWNCIQKKCD